MLKKLILVLFFNITIQASTVIVKNESQFQNITIAAYFKKFCGKGKANILNLNETYTIPDNKQIVLFFSINDFEFDYETKKNLNYIFNIENDGIYLNDAWGEGTIKEGLLLSTPSTKIFSFE